MKTTKVSINAPVTLAYVFVSFVILVIGLVTGGRSTQLLFMTWHSSLLSPLTWLRFFTLLLGPMLEEKYGTARIIEVIAMTALITALVNYIFFPSSALCGASGVVFAFILLSSFTGFRQGEIPLTFILAAVFYIGQQAAQGLFVRDQISQLSHIIGGLVGACAGFALNVEKR